MATSGVARRYARAVFQIAQAEHDVDGWLRDLRVIRDVLQSPRLAAYLDNPALGVDEKIRAVANSLNTLGVQRRNLVFLLIENGRANQIGDIVSTFEQEVNRARGVVIARVTTAVPLDDRDERFLTNRLESITGRKVQMQTDVDPTLIGGFVARVGDQLLDASVIGRLAQLRARLLA
jgi:F-type H+-transporting ATPase subunit delta